MTDSLENILNKMILFNETKMKIFLLKNVKDELDKSCEKDIVFYRIHGNDPTLTMFTKRLRKGNPGIVIFNKKPSVKVDCAYAVVSEKNFFYFQKKFCDIIYPANIEKNKIVGITGTNGKTSVCHFLSESLAHLGYSVLSIGTIGVSLRSQVGHEILKEYGLTTPSYICLRKLLFEHSVSVDFIVMELSSHGLEQNRLGDIKIDIGVWTNFTQDHLDYHKNMEQYFLAKSKIYHCLKPSAKVLVHKDHNEILDKLDNYYLSKTALIDCLELMLNQSDLNNPLFKGFMLKNIAAVFFSVKELLNIKIEQWDFITLPPGRFNVIEKGNKIIVVDYAHTPDALENLICLAKIHFIDKKINILFGCGGERDKEKRPKMGIVAETHANKIYITSDNPRNEDPDEILKQIKSFLSKPVIENVDRKKTIKIAIDETGPGEVLLVAGKGHECYQDIQGIKHPFDDLKIVKECLNL